MSVDSSNSWAADIRLHVYQLIIILASLVAIAAGYTYSSQVMINDVREANNRFHLLANLHYARATQELRNLKSHHLLGREPHPAAEEQPSPAEFIRSDAETSIQSHLALEKIAEGLILENQYSDQRFTTLSNRLRDRAQSFSEKRDAYETHRGDERGLLDSIDSLRITLEQISRLHTIARDEKLQKLNDLEQLHDRIFYILIIMLSGVATIVARRGFSSINRIIGTQVKTEEKIKHQAHHDALTGLPNRFLALDRLSRMMKDAYRHSSKVAVLFIDLDNFKKVNDLLGHVGGDKLLVEAAQRINQSVRSGDTIGRLGGDEFIVLAAGISQPEEVMTIAENLIKILREAFVIDGKEFILTASIGITVYPDDGDDKLELIRKADSAMYHSKESGRNTFSYFNESMNRNILRQLELEEQIYGALDRNEFEVFYQQKVDLASNRIIGAEALLRWNSEVLGAVQPDEFIPVAEQTGLIVPIGEFVLREALEMAKHWQEELLPEFKIAVNLSPRQFRDPDLINKISRFLLELGVSSKSLELEITEGVLMTEHINIEQALADINKLGIVIAMDDFGTGYSSLSYVRKFPFGVIKIDRGFIQDIDRNPMSLELNQAAIAMAHALNIRVVAEGVETRAQFRILQDLKCDVAQGYYFGRPMPAQQMSELLRSQKPKPQVVPGPFIAVQQ